MIKIITTIDSLSGVASPDYSPWETPAIDLYQAKKLASGGDKLISKDIYDSMNLSFLGNVIYVDTDDTEKLRDGFQATGDLNSFLKSHDNVWVIGGSQIFNKILDKVDELYLTQLDGDFNCREYFPMFGNKFIMVQKSKIRADKTITYQNQVWKAIRLANPQEIMDSDNN